MFELFYTILTVFFFSLFLTEESVSLRCWDCSVNFTSEYYLNNHLLFHIKQPRVLLTRIQEPPIKITLKSKSDNSFEIISSPNGRKLNSPTIKTDPDGLETQEENSLDRELKEAEQEEQQEAGDALEEDEQATMTEDTEVDGEALDYEGPTHVSFSPNFAGENGSNESGSPGDKNEENKDESNSNDCGIIPGAEPTPPPEPSPEFPKIRIKRGLLKESLTITEITDDNPNGEPQTGKLIHTFALIISHTIKNKIKDRIEIQG